MTVNKKFLEALSKDEALKAEVEQAALEAVAGGVCGCGGIGGGTGTGKQCFCLFPTESGQNDSGKSCSCPISIGAGADDGSNAP